MTSGCTIQTLLEIPFLEFKGVFRSQGHGENCLEGEKVNGKAKIHVEFK